ncbi:MAG: hypothetical protein WC787_01130 [Patescibacteria group bacterium]|jgi:hypothetical protein
MPTAFAALETSGDGCCTCTAKNGTSADVCIDLVSETTCTNLVAVSQNSTIKNLKSCSFNPNCKAISSGGQCSVGPISESLYKGEGTGGSTSSSEGGAAPASVGLIAPKLNVTIPGLVFSEKAIVDNGFIQIPFFAQYVAAVYKLLVVISAIAAAIMIVYGGFLYIVGATGAKVRKGKTVIVDAVIGLMLVLGAYIILQTVNQDTVSFNNQNLRLIVPEKANLESVPVAAYWKETSDGPPPEPGSTKKDGACDLTMNQANLPTVKSVYQCALTIAKEIGIPPCYVIIAINHESYLALPNMVGHDENVTAKVGAGGGLIKARKDFLAAGTTFKGKPVTENSMNDDTPPDFTRDDLGFDPRFSHGAGLTGFTIKCIEGECFTRKQLLSTYNGIRAGALGVRAVIKQTKGNATDPDVVRQVWVAYRGTEVQKRINETLGCFKLDDPLQAIYPGQFIICRGDLPLDKAQCADEVARSYAGLISPGSACNTFCADKRMPVSCGGGDKVCKLRPSE